LLLYELDHIVN